MDYFLKEAETSGGTTGYQTLINAALRQHVEGNAPKLEDTRRRGIHESVLFVILSILKVLIHRKDSISRRQRDRPIYWPPTRACASW